jgi:NAD(P)-dependent dehydrogenase (short-subunit alcohol dehydrogenase family)
MPGTSRRHAVRTADRLSSIARAQEAVYSGAKAGVIGFSKAPAAEIACHGISVNLVSPGSTETLLLRTDYDEEQLERRRSRHPVGRLGQPSDIAETIAFFAGSDGYVNGPVLGVNGAASGLG